MEKFDPLSFEIPGQHFVDGLLLNVQCSERFLRQIQEIQYAATDIIVAAYPKTGTTLLQEVVELVRHNGEVDNEKQNYVRVPYLEVNFNDDPEKLDRTFSSLPHPRTVKTHFPLNVVKDAVLAQKVRCIYGVRHPKDTMVSFYHFYRMNELLGRFPGTWDDFFEMIMADRLFSSNIFDHYLSWWRHRHLPNILIVRYEDLIGQPKSEIVKIAKFCGEELSDDLIDKIVHATSFEAMKKNPSTNYSEVPLFHQEVSPFMRKGVSGDWKNYFSTDQCRRFDAMMKERLSDEPELVEFIHRGAVDSV